MKTLFNILTILIFSSVTLFSQYRLFVEGVQTTMTRYDQNGVVNGTAEAIYRNVIKSNLNLQVTASTTFKDRNGTVQLTRDFGTKLNVNSISGTQSLFIDMKYFIPLQTAIQFKNYGVNATGNAYEIPSRLMPVLVLNSISMNYTFTPSVSGFSSANTQVIFSNRTVQNREKLTVPAGTFMTWKITEDVEIRSSTITKQKVTRWVNDEIGIVKIEVRNYSTGALIETEQLTRFQNPTTISSGK
jgi:hypothetical protein